MLAIYFSLSSWRDACLIKYRDNFTSSTYVPRHMNISVLSVCKSSPSAKF
jgi:hypothetical protein